MIYIFKGVKTVCALPGQACKECGNLCHKLNCDPMRECCNAVGQACVHFTDKPLSSFVIIAWIMSGLELFFCFSALTADETQDCEFVDATGKSIGITAWLVVQMGFAILNIVFAPWFQHQVWKRICKMVTEQGFSLVQGTQGEDADVAPKSTVAESFKHVILYDFGVLFYFFALIASFIWSYMGGSWIMDHHCVGKCNATGDAGWAYYMGLCFFWVAFLYSFCYYCCSCCSGSVALSAVRGFRA